MASPDEGNEADEATVALPADLAGSSAEPEPVAETPAALPEIPAEQAGEAEPAPSEEAADGTPDETVTPATQEPDETILPAPVAGSEGDAGPEDRTVALPPGAQPSEPPLVRQAGRLLVGRRALLAASAGAAAAAIVGGFAARVTSRIPLVDDPRGQHGNPAGGMTSTSPGAQATHVATPSVPVQRAPIFTLSEYRKATGAGPFPADAIALTIDDGPHPVWTPKILRLLDKYHVPAMFCMIGNQVLGHENIARMVTAAGHQLANHTWSHPTSLAKKPGELVYGEITRAQAKIQKTTGRVPKFFRSPGGDWSPTVLKQTAAAGLLPLDWTNDPKDWARPGAGKIEHTMLAARPGQILLCHDGGGDRSQTYSALKVVLPQLKARGLSFVAL